MWPRENTTRLVTNYNKYPHTLRVARGNDGVWQVIKELDLLGSWTIWEVSGHSPSNPRTVRDYIIRLVRGGYAQQTQEIRGNRKINSYRLLRKPIEAPHLDKDGKEYDEPINETLWRSIRMAKHFSIKEISEASGKLGSPIKYDTVRRYLLDLVNCGVLAVTRLPGTDNTYRLLKDIGSKAPKIFTAHAVFDPNNNCFLSEAIAKEVQP